MKFTARFLRWLADMPNRLRRWADLLDPPASIITGPPDPPPPPRGE